MTSNLTVFIRSKRLNGLMNPFLGKKVSLNTVPANYVFTTKPARLVCFFSLSFKKTHFLDLAHHHANSTAKCIDCSTTLVIFFPFSLSAFLFAFLYLFTASVANVLPSLFPQKKRILLMAHTKFTEIMTLVPLHLEFQVKNY